MPSIDTSDDFLNFAKDRLRTHYSDQKRFQDRKESVELVPGRKDPCVRYHLTVVDAHEDVDKAGHTLGHIALYDHGFICRLPNNKNLGLDFIYGINSYTPLKNDDLSDRAKKLFSQLKF
jgi:hypothetical protein